MAYYQGALYQGINWNAMMSNYVTYDFPTPKTLAPGDTLTIPAGGLSLTMHSDGTTTPNIVPKDARYISSALYSGRCAHCEGDIEVGEPIWHLSYLEKTNGGKTRIWCGCHKKHDDRVDYAAKDNDKEQDDMARRQDFTFPYTGAQIAASLERKAADFEAKITESIDLDETTLRIVLGETGAQQRLEQEQGKLKALNDELTKRAARARKEAVPYAQAASKEFELDLEDIAHYGLNEGDVEPVEAPRQRRTRRKRDAETGELIDA